MYQRQQHSPVGVPVRVLVPERRVLQVWVEQALQHRLETRVLLHNPHHPERLQVFHGLVRGSAQRQTMELLGIFPSHEPKDET